MDQRELSLAVVGIGYLNSDKAGSDRRFEVLTCEPGEAVELRPEPTNRKDRNAVAVFSVRDVQLGYLTAERAPWIGAKLRAGEPWRAIFQAAGASAAFIRVRFGGGEPTLPMPRRNLGRATVDDFHADPDGPMWGA